MNLTTITVSIILAGMLLAGVIVVIVDLWPDHIHTYGPVQHDVENTGVIPGRENKRFKRSIVRVTTHDTCTKCGHTRTGVDLRYDYTH